MIYFAQDQGTYHIKIGFTDKPDAEARLKNLDTGNPLGLVLLATTPGTREDEDRLHKQFHSAHLRGEWFCPVPELLRHIVSTQAATSNNEMYAKKKLKSPLSIYLAGKISGFIHWRHEILPQSFQEFRSRDLDGWPILKNAIFETHHYTGPFFLANYRSAEDQHGLDAQVLEHGGLAGCCGGEGCKHCHDTGVGYESRAPKIVDLCLKAIEASDVVFAWVDSLDCYGTIVEVGYAAALKKAVWIAGPREFRDMWFLRTLADSEYCWAKSAKDALATFIFEHLGQK